MDAAEAEGPSIVDLCVGQAIDVAGHIDGLAQQIQCTKTACAAAVGLQRQGSSAAFCACAGGVNANHHAGIIVSALAKQAH